MHLNFDSCNRFTNRYVIRPKKRDQSLLNNGSAKKKDVYMVMPYQWGIIGAITLDNF